MSFGQVKRELDKLDKKSIIKLISELYKKNKSVKEHLDFFASNNEDEINVKYHNMVYEAFYPNRGNGFNLKNGNQAIS